MPHPIRHLLIFASTWLALAGGASALSYLVNPLGVFPTRLIPPAVWTDRADKPPAYKRLDPRPQAIVLGSSRSMKINPSEITRRTGLAAFNFAVTAATVEDHEAIVKFCLARDGPRVERLFIGVDPDAFHNASDVSRALLRSPDLGPHAGGSAPSVFDDLIGWSAISLSLKSLHQRVRFGPQPPRGVFGSDGFLTYPAWEQEMRGGTFRFEPKLAFAISEYRDKFQGFRALDGRRKERFAALLRLVKTAGVRVDAFTTVLHPRLVEALGSTPFEARTRETRRFLAGLESEGLLRFCDVATLEDFGGDPDGYFDGAHMTEANATRLFTHVLSCEAGRHGLQ